MGEGGGYGPSRKSDVAEAREKHLRLHVAGRQSEMNVLWGEVGWQISLMRVDDLPAGWLISVWWKAPASLTEERNKSARRKKEAADVSANSISGSVMDGWMDGWGRGGRI